MHQDELIEYEWYCVRTVTGSYTFAMFEDKCLGFDGCYYTQQELVEQGVFEWVHISDLRECFNHFTKSSSSLDSVFTHLLTGRLIKAMTTLSEDERMMVINAFCKYCGRKEKPNSMCCQCTNDE